MSKDLRTVVVIDYQNVHLTGHGLFASTRYLPKHETLVDPCSSRACSFVSGTHASAPTSNPRRFARCWYTEGSLPASTTRTVTPGASLSSRNGSGTPG